MRNSRKPVRKCHKCLLNLGDHCWGFECPHDEWRGHRRCRGFENPAVYDRFLRWQEESRVKTRKQLRQEVFRKKKAEPHWNHFMAAQNRRG